MSDSAFVVDNSIVISWCFQDARNAYADAVLNRLQNAQAFVPAIWTLEVVNVLLAAERHKRLKPADSARFLDLLSRLPIQVEQGELEKEVGVILSLGREQNLSSYDAAYLALAMRHGLPLATLDNDLRAAAKRVGVALLEE